MCTTIQPLSKQVGKVKASTTGSYNRGVMRVKMISNNAVASLFWRAFAEIGELSLKLESFR